MHPGLVFLRSPAHCQNGSGAAGADLIHSVVVEPRWHNSCHIGLAQGRPTIQIDRHSEPWQCSLPPEVQYIDRHFRHAQFLGRRIGLCCFEPTHETVYKLVLGVCCSPAFQITCLSKLGRIALSRSKLPRIEIFVHAPDAPGTSGYFQRAWHAQSSCNKATHEGICGMTDVVRFGVARVPHINQPRGALAQGGSTHTMSNSLAFLLRPIHGHI